MLLLTPQNFPDYELLDTGNFEKLERFGKYITIRPEPQAVWNKVLPEQDWQKKAHVKFIPKSSNSGEWKRIKEMPDQWTMQYGLPDNKKITFRLGLTAFKHVGIFPEQAVNWNYIYNSIRKCKADKPRFLNLFAYTGGASLATSTTGTGCTTPNFIGEQF